MNIQEMRHHLAGLVVFRALRKDTVVAKFERMLQVNTTNLDEVIEAVADFSAALFQSGTNWTTYLENLVLESENICICQAAKAEQVQF